MAATELTVQNATLDGLDIVYTAANADGNYFTNNGKTVLLVKNGSGGDITVTTDSQVNSNQGYDNDEDAVIGAGDTNSVGSFNKNRFNDSDGYVQVTYSSVTSITVAAVNVYPG